MDSDAAMQPQYEWNTIPWKKYERQVFKLQKRIYRASEQGNVCKVRRLQRLLNRSHMAKCMAVRRVTQDNRGKATAGVDGVKSLGPKRRLALVDTLKVGVKGKPVRRVEIPKPGTDEKRPLGIPTMHDRALQTLVKLALEPEWEARFESNSYGFRPGRSTWDATAAIFNYTNKKPKWVLDADISKCFDRIDHAALLKKLNTSSEIRKQIKSWLKAGVMVGLDFSPTESGTPQGGAISPLLANIALHGMEEYITRLARNSGYNNVQIVRYADDLVLFHPQRGVVVRCQKALEKWLSKMGLELKPSKTRIVHTYEKHDGEVGFDFLGFNVRHYLVAKRLQGKDRWGNLVEHKLFIMPSKKAIKRHYDHLCEIVDAHIGKGQQELIDRLNPVIRGWSNYYSRVVSKKIFTKLGMMLWKKLWPWATRRHPRKGHKWVARKYWRRETGKWLFAVTDGNKQPLASHADTVIKRHEKVRESKSPFDGDWVYWARRAGSYPGVSAQAVELLNNQKGRCLVCGLRFTSEDMIEVDHIIPRSQGGSDRRDNKQVLHGHCHDQKTARDLKLKVKVVKPQKESAVVTRRNMVKPHGLVYKWDLNVLAQSEWKPSELSDEVWERALILKTELMSKIKVYEEAIQGHQNWKGKPLSPEEVAQTEVEYQNWKRKENIMDEFITPIRERVKRSLLNRGKTRSFRLDPVTGEMIPLE